MRDDQFRFLSILGQVPARLTAEQVAWLLNCGPHDIPILVVARLLKPLGAAAPNSVKYFASCEVMENAKDRVWLSKMTSTLGQHWREKNRDKRERTLQVAANGHDAPLVLVH